MRLATTDILTGLANRTLWYDRVNQAVAMAKRSPSKNVVLMQLDLNLFKCINDTLGHSAGDMVLRQVAKRLKATLRDGDTLARMGGDEFGILLPLEDDGRKAAETVAQKVQRCFLKPFPFGGHQLYLGLSVGIAIHPEDSSDPDTLVRQADMAMYTSKKNNSSYEYYTPDLDEPSKRLHLVSQMKQGLHNQEFELHFQPKIDLLNDQTNGFEALMRWHHPQQGDLLPDTFIPIAEKMGLIHELTEWALADALKQSKTWQKEGIHAPVAVNLSAHSFQDKTFLKHILSALDIAETTPELLELEITENTLMSNIDGAADTLRALSSIGVAIAIDDFGTGYSSLSYLKKLPIDQLKIDKSFVIDMDSDKSDAAIVRSVIDLGHNLGIKVVAEGVEKPECITMLKDLGCDSAQGFHIGKPMPINQLSHWFTSKTMLSS
ncbi:putative bifunctional diguanylate cyclase/phosphodiesterase [Pseudomonadota bacterium]